MVDADFLKIQEKWQKRWADESVFKVSQNKGKKFYCLEMFPYPSNKLHVGHLRNYSIGDSIARFKRMQGYNVLYPMGYDSFGLPAENAAIKNKINPKDWTLSNIESIKAQQKRMGLSYDWDREVVTCKPDYYKWNQWIFLKLFEKGLAYKKEAMVNWCPECKTVLANEQVVNGSCWRCSSEVTQKKLSQWFFKITAYADELLKDLEKLEHWPEKVKLMQKNWIGKSHGVDVYFKVENSDITISTFTTRCDTIFSVTFLVLAPENELVDKLVKGTKYESEVAKVRKEVSKQSVIERTTETGKDKLGCFIGRYAINPASGDKIPIYIANFALAEYGTGAVMADAHDQRDFEFAKKYDIPLKFVISEDGKPLDVNKATKAQIEDGILYDSGDFSGMHNREALPKMAEWLENISGGKRVVNYKLRDWLISRQRYWGTPIPIIQCKECGSVAVSEDELPVILPEDVNFQSGGNPIRTSPSFINTKCPKCGGAAERETDTMDTFVDSSWYFLRFCDSKNETGPFSKESVDYFMEVDQYIGGIEHAVMHLLYARFFTKFLRDIGLVSVDEPFKRLLTQGMVTKDGAKMSKSLGNTVDPDEFVSKMGADTGRLFILFAALPEKEMDWSDQGVNGSYRFLQKLFRLTELEFNSDDIKKTNLSTKEKYLLSVVNRTTGTVTNLISSYRFSTAITELMEVVNAFTRYAKECSPSVRGYLLKRITLLLAPFTPHICEEIWELLGNKGFVSLAKWPSVEEKWIDESIEASEDLLQDVRADIIAVKNLTGIKPKKIFLLVSHKWKYDFISKFKAAVEKTREPSTLIKECMTDDLKRYGKQIVSTIPRLLKDSSKIPKIVTSQENELNVLKESSALLSQEFGCELELMSSEESKNPKANNSMPGKPALILE